MGDFILPQSWCVWWNRPVDWAEWSRTETIYSNDETSEMMRRWQEICAWRMCLYTINRSGRHCWRLSVSTARGIKGSLRKLATNWRQIVCRVVIGCIRRIGWSSIEHTDMPEFSKWSLLLRWFCRFSIEFHLLGIYAWPINSGTLEISSY